MKKIKFENGSEIIFDETARNDIKRSKKDIIIFWKKCPSDFMEVMFGIKLLWWQKLIWFFQKD